MELKEFVSQSLLHIFNGVKTAQKEIEDKEGTIAPAYPFPKSDSINIVGAINSQPIILVNFDVSITTTDLSSNKAGFGLFVAAFGGGAQTGSQSTNNEFSRLRFAIPVVLPVQSAIRNSK